MKYKISTAHFHYSLNSKVESCEPNKGTETKTIHEVSGFNYVVISPYYPTKRETYRGPDAGKVFLDRILSEEKEILKLMDKANKPMMMTVEDQQTFSKSDTCYICSESFVEHKDGLIIPSSNAPSPSVPVGSHPCSLW